MIRTFITQLYDLSHFSISPAIFLDYLSLWDVLPISYKTLPISPVILCFITSASDYAFFQVLFSTFKQNSWKSAILGSNMILTTLGLAVAMGIIIGVQ